MSYGVSGYVGINNHQSHAEEVQSITGNSLSNALPC